MKVDVLMPKLGESLTEGTILKWWKKVGDPVEKDETLLEVSTDKVDSEIPSPAKGVLVEILAEENQTVEIEALLARIETAEKKVPEERSPRKKTPAEEPVAKKVAPKSEESTAPSAGGIVDVLMPKLGESLTEGTVLKWWKKVGDPVEKDETLLEVSTDKVDSEIPSPVAGVLQEIVVDENETVTIDAVLARIKTTKPVTEEKAPATKPAERKSAAQPKMPHLPKELSEMPVMPTETPAKEKGSRFYSPLVLSIARKENISMPELERIPGSGAGGRVSKKDILNYLKERTAKPVAGAQPVQPLSFKSSERELVIPMDAIRKRIAAHMRHSLDTSAHVYSVSECDMTNTLNLMHRQRPDFLKEEGFKLTITPFILYAVAKAILDFPRINSSLKGDNIVEKKYINLGIAVAGPKGLIVPVVKNVEERSFRGLARAVHDLVSRTRNNQLTVDDVQGATFTVTNYGIFGNIIGLPIINQPNVAILGIGAIKKRPVVIERPEGDSIGIRSMTYISMSYDHRLVDGELGGRFMERLVEYLEKAEF